MVDGVVIYRRTGQEHSYAALTIGYSDVIAPLVQWTQMPKPDPQDFSSIFPLIEEGC